MARRKVPSQAATGADTFSDSIVGRQITDGTSQLTNTSFALDRVIPEKDTKNFKSGKFSDFLTLEDLKEEVNTSFEKTTTERKKEIKFKSSKNDAGKSLFGSLKSRIGASLIRIIKNYPAGILIDKDSLVKSTNSGFTAYDVTYDLNFNTTEFSVDFSKLYNPFDVIFKTPESSTIVNSENKVRDFFQSYTKYVIEISGNQFPILFYTEPNNVNIIKLKVSGKPFTINYSENILIKPNNGVVEEFYGMLDDLESSLLNRETNPKYTATFKVPRDSFDGSKTSLIDVDVTWPISKDEWNIKIIGLDYENYIGELTDISDEIDNYKSNLFVRFMSSPQLYEFDTDDKRVESVFQL
jgi:hypothetical protein